MQNLTIIHTQVRKVELKIRFAEHQRYIKNNNPKSAYVLHNLNKRHEYRTIQDTKELLKLY